MTRKHLPAFVAFGLLVTAMPPLHGQSIDFGYAPTRWMTPIGMPDDWQKTMVLHDGRLAYHLELFASLPSVWIEPTDTIRVTDAPTEFGRLSLSVEAEPVGRG
jgi:hypothetical protein